MPGSSAILDGARGLFGAKTCAAMVPLALLLTLLTGLAAPAQAQSPGRPGDFDYLTLALTWSPSFCSEPRNRRERQCRRTNRPYAFVLHGVWPQYEKGWPEFCRTRKKPWVPRKVIDSMLDIMPSPKLVIHQFRKHGVCSGLTAERYFRLSRILFERVKIPRRFINPGQGLSLTPRDVEEAFLKANPKLEPEMIAVSCGRSKRLREVRICFNKKGRFRQCSVNENQRRLCRQRKVFMPPVRRGEQDTRGRASGDRAGLERLLNGG